MSEENDHLPVPMMRKEIGLLCLFQKTKDPLVADIDQSQETDIDLDREIDIDLGQETGVGLGQEIDADLGLLVAEEDLDQPIDEDLADLLTADVRIDKDQDPLVVDGGTVSLLVANGSPGQETGIDHGLPDEGLARGLLEEGRGIVGIIGVGPRRDEAARNIQDGVGVVLNHLADAIRLETDYIPLHMCYFFLIVLLSFLLIWFSF